MQSARDLPSASMPHAPKRELWRLRSLPRLADPDYRFDGHAGMQTIQAGLVPSQTNSHRQTLHHFHVVAGGVFRWKHAVDGACRSGHALDETVEFPIQSVDAYADRLAGMHVLELRLFEIGGHPHVVCLTDGEQFLARPYLLAHLHALLPRYASDGR